MRAECFAACFVRDTLLFSKTGAHHKRHLHRPLSGAGWPLTGSPDKPVVFIRPHQVHGPLWCAPASAASVRLPATSHPPEATSCAAAVTLLANRTPLLSVRGALFGAPSSPLTANTGTEDAVGETAAAWGAGESAQSNALFCRRRWHKTRKIPRATSTCWVKRSSSAACSIRNRYVSSRAVTEAERGSG